VISIWGLSFFLPNLPGGPLKVEEGGGGGGVFFHNLNC
jgi:hypothetical protein